MSLLGAAYAGEEKLGGMKLEDAKRWWAFQPIAQVPGGSVDALFEKSSSVAAERRVLLRRVTYDLTGLPPTPAEVDAFVADGSPDAYSKVVERLLASPAYGEKWGRYWLDVVRYADTAGENSDRPLPHAWRYRNWVIDALNRDLPYDAFVRQQLAGDLLAAKESEGEAAANIVATGFLAIARRFGHEIEKDMHLTFEDAIDTTGKAFLGLTLGCARCHDHKYDPISTRDYYALYGMLQSTRFPFTGCEPKPHPRDLVPLPSGEVKRATAAWEAEMKALEAAVATADAALNAKGNVFASSVPVAISAGEIGPTGAQEVVVDEAHALAMKQGEMLQLSILPRANFGGDSTVVEWVISEVGGSGKTWNVTADFLHNPNAAGAGVWQVFDLVPNERPLTELVRDAEKTAGLLIWHGPEPWPALLINTKQDEAKFQTVKMPPQSVAVHPGPRGGVALAWESPAEMTVTVKGKVAKIDPGGDGVAWKLERRPSIAEGLAAQKLLSQQVVTAKKARDAAMVRKPVADLAFAVIDAKPLNARVQKKGEPKDLAEEVPRGVPVIFGGAPVAESAGSGRLELADCLTRGSAKDLLARVMVNRLWAGHFGAGIVATPNDFGTRGTLPSHPALLEFLAAEFIKQGWSIKAMHRLILQSAAYQHADFPRRRLTAEEMRDTLLTVSGKLDRSPGGPHPFPAESTWTFTQHGPFKAVYDNDRRSIYQMVQRTQRHPFLALFDGADPNASTPVRGQSTVPTQALYFLNDPFVHTQAKAMAARLVAAAPDNAARLNLATRELYGRSPNNAESELMKQFLTETAAAMPSLSEPERTIDIWAAWLRVLFGTNELLYVD